MRTRLWAGALGALILGLATACAATTAEQTKAEDPTAAPAARRLKPAACRWVPVAPEWNEPCNESNRGATLDVTVREDMRPESARKTTSTCQCD
jgi:hypothetical protein